MTERRGRRRWVSVLALTVLVTTGVTACATDSGRAAQVPERPGPLRIMTLGDSITLGPDEDGGFGGGYRARLWDRLVERDGMRVEFVGSVRSGEPALNHEGHGGWRIDQLRGIVDAALAVHRPDLVLLHIGTNDIGQQYALDGAPDRLRDLAERICTDRPDADLVLASIIPIGSLERLIDTYNAAVPGIVAGLQESGCRAHHVDMNSAVSSFDLFDGVHPVPAAYDKMTDLWYPEITAAYDRVAEDATVEGTARYPVDDARYPVNDDVLDYQGYWRSEHDRADAHWSDEHRSGNTGDTATFTFTGTGVTVHGATGPDGGIAAVTVDGGPEVMVDQYAPQRGGQVPVYRSPPLADGTHELKVRVTGRSNPASSGTVVGLDRLDVAGG